ncbi:MAG: hypothetical protein BroJett020_17830 [Bacteroidota bacterium]|nr:MAG: hypothetical protein BroJett020_17830 [Bacteroidota bacterium]
MLIAKIHTTTPANNTVVIKAAITFSFSKSSVENCMALYFLFTLRLNPLITFFKEHFATYKRIYREKVASSRKNIII